MSSRIATLKRLAEQLQGSNKARADACNRLAEAYWSGDGVEEDEGAAVKWMIKASELGHAEAQCNLGVSFDKGMGVAQSYEKAFHWYQKAADQGHAMAQCNLGISYYHGRGVAQSYEKAFHWFQKAADQGVAKAQYNLGNHYYHGRGVAQSYEKAVEWYQKGADQVNAKAQYNLGVCYSQGRGVAQSHKKAVEWFQKAANQGYAEAQNNLGNCYIQGRGVAQNHKKAFDWFQKAADQGDAEAQLNLGHFYQHGTGVVGVPKSLKKAKRLFKLAAKQGFAPAHAALAKLEAASGKDADIRKTQKHLNKARAALAAAGSEASAEDKRVVQVLYEQAKLASLFRCHNEGCSVAYSEDVSVQSAKLKSCARCRKVAYCSVECQTADWKARHKDECGKRLEVGETFLLCKLKSRPELNGCRVEVVRGMDEASHQVGVRVVSEAPRAAGAAAEGEDNEERKGNEEDGSEAGSVVVGLVLSVKPKNLKKTE